MRPKVLPAWGVAPSGGLWGARGKGLDALEWYAVASGMVFGICAMSVVTCLAGTPGVEEEDRRDGGRAARHYPYGRWTSPIGGWYPVRNAVHVTVASGAGWSDGRMDAELELVKTSLLYGDHTTLASIGAAGVAAARSALSGSPEEKRDVLIDVASLIVPPDQEALFQLLRHPDVQRLPGYAALIAGLDPILGEADGVIGAFLERSGLAELEPAERAGLLTIDLLGIDPVEFLKSSIGLAVQRSGNPSVSAAATGPGW